MLNYSVSEKRWRYACRQVIFISGAFFIFSVLMWAADVKSNYIHALGPGFYFAGSGMVFLLMLRSGGVLAPIAWYVAGTGLYFGMGTALWGIRPDLHYNPDLQVVTGDLARINLLNSTSILIVLTIALMLCAKNKSTRNTAAVNPISWLVIYKLIIPLALTSVVMDYYFFPLAKDFTIRSLQSKLSYIVSMYLLLTGVLWKNLSIFKRSLSVFVVVGIFVLGILSLSKTSVVYPILSLMAGYWVNNRSAKSLLVPIFLLLVGIVFVLIPLTQQGRSNSAYNAGKDSVLARTKIVGKYTNSQRQQAKEPGVRALSRFSHAPYQRFLMNEYEAGRRGTSLDDSWVALVPRFFWPDKPNVTRFGVLLYNLFNNTSRGGSALAPTYSAEAYWNYGGLGVLMISVLLGLQLGWLTKHWFYAIRGQRGPAYLVIAFPAAFLALNVETWIAASYFGGFITLLVIWALVKMVISKLKNTHKDKRPSIIFSK